MRLEFVKIGRLVIIGVVVLMVYWNKDHIQYSGQHLDTIAKPGQQLAHPSTECNCSMVKSIKVFNTLDNKKYKFPTHYLPNRGNAACLHSRKTCLNRIEELTEIEPKLLSYLHKRKQYTHHAKNGQQFIVPNIVHYVNYGHKFPFYAYVSFKSASKFIRPSLILLWGDDPGTDVYWWKRVTEEVPNVYVVQTEESDILFGKEVQYKLEHLSDVLRLNVLRGMV